MKICMVVASYPEMRCGIGDYTARLVNSLAERNCELTVITSSHPEIKGSLREGSKVKVEACVKKWGFTELPAVLRRIKMANPDIVHIQYQWWMYHKRAMITLLPFFLKRLFKKCTVVTTFHDLTGPYLFPKVLPLRRYCVKLMAIFSDYIIAPNEMDARSLISRISPLSKRLKHIPSGAGLFLNHNLPVSISKIRRKLTGDKDCIIISNFGYVIPYKGLEDLLQAIKILVDKGYSILFISIGGFSIEPSIDSSYHSKLQRMVDELGIRDCVEWVGHKNSDGAASYLLASDICVMPFTDGVSGRRSSFTSVLSFGLPIVTTVLDNVSEKLIDHHNVLLVPACNHLRLAEAIEELINSAELRRKLGKAAQILYDEEYSWDVIAERTLKVYKNSHHDKINSKCR